MSDPSAEPPRKYERPPVIERVISVYSDVEERRYEEESPSWFSEVQEEYPFAEPLEEWLLNVEEQDGVSLLDSITPEFKMTPRFAKRPKSQVFDWSIRCPRGQFTINMHSVPGDGRSFSDLRMEWLKWLPRWSRRFEVERFTWLQMIYVNRLSAQTLPDFVPQGGNGLLIGQVLKVFMSIPGEHECLIPPWDCKATVQLENPKKAQLEIHLLDRASQHGSAAEMDLRLTVRVVLDDSIVDSNALISIIDLCHDKITERFEQLFTKEALISFKPVTA